MSIDEGSNNFDCHDVDDMRQLLNYLSDSYRETSTRQQDLISLYELED